MALECVLLILNINILPNEVAWDTIKRMISAPNFQLSILNYVLDESLAIKLHYALELIVYSPEFLATDFPTKAGTVLRDWVSALHKYIRIVYISQNKQKTLTELETKQQNHIDKINDLSKLIIISQNNIKEFKSTYDQFMANKDNNRIRLKECQSRLDSCTEIISHLNEFRALIKISLDESSEENSHLLSKCILGACSTAFLGNFSPNARKLITDKWIHELAKISIPSPLEFNLSELFFSKSIEEVCYGSNLPVDIDTVEKMLIAQRQISVPLIFDSRMLAEAYIRALDCKSKKIITFHASDEDIIKNILQAKKNGWKVILYIDIENVSESLDDLIQNIRVSRPQLFKARESHKAEDEFYLYLISNKKAKYCTRKRWMQWVSPICLFHSPIAAENMFAIGLCEFFNKRLHKKFIKNKMDYYSNEENIKILLERSYQLINNMECEELFGGDVIIFVKFRCTIT